ncbi:hypothetical protein E2N92_12170 [Methanofollis formosanus]|uniref:Peptidase C1A papain C-terminal domain-containing protein n=1 Tax=Methanofollis formosanus TaxID=299308 RepID=A0A8G1EGS3_9EURY|nr:C1 family peptidase [Methanofollis formosanus]QYZ80128.1 hypothetical protein E2N92_12170 [Methanofollis formosanus]
MDIRILAAVLVGAVLFVGVAVVQAPASLPSAYDLRDVDGKCLVTPVKTQGGTLPDGRPDIGNTVGACWAFAACAAFESSLLHQEIVSDPASPAAHLSAWHMANWNGYNHPVYTFNPDLTPNGTFSFGYTESEPVIRGWGGDHRYAIDYFSSGRGPVLERSAPFPLDEIQERQVLTPPPERLPVSYMLREALVFSRPDYAADEEYRTAVKRALLQHGALLSYHFADPSIYPGQNESSIFNRTSNDYYFDGTGDGPLPPSLNHAVTIAGWDDTRQTQGAPEPGAWLIKNSHGTAFGDEGYFWISYADALFLKGNDFAVALVAGSGEGYDTGNRYETHAGALSNVSTEPSEIAWDYLSDGFAADGGESWACARFTAEEDAALRAVGFMTLNRNEHLTVTVYDGWDEAGNRPDPNRLVLSKDLSVPEQGYHLVDLDRQVPLKKGDEFVIALGFAARDDAAEITEPLVYVSSADTPPANRTFRSRSDPADGRDGWEDYAALHDGGIFYVQGFTAG